MFAMHCDKPSKGGKKSKTWPCQRLKVTCTKFPYGLLLSSLYGSGIEAQDNYGAYLGLYRENMADTGLVPRPV